MIENNPDWVALGYLTFPIVQRLRPAFDTKDGSKSSDNLPPPPPPPPPKKGRHKVTYNQAHRFGDVMSSPTPGESASAAEEEHTKGPIYYKMMLNHSTIKPEIDQFSAPKAAGSNAGTADKIDLQRAKVPTIKKQFSQVWCGHCLGRFLTTIGCNQSNSSGANQKSLICPEVKPMTPHQENTFLIHSSHQLPCLCLRPLKGFLS